MKHTLCFNMILLSIRTDLNTLFNCLTYIQNMEQTFKEIKKTFNKSNKQKQHNTLTWNQQTFSNVHDSLLYRLGLRARRLFV